MKINHQQIEQLLIGSVITKWQESGSGPGAPAGLRDLYAAYLPVIVLEIQRGKIGAVDCVVKVFTNDGKIEDFSFERNDIVTVLE